MNIYQVIMTPDAIDDMTALGNYIADVLGAPKSALSYVRAVRKEIGTLSEMPFRYRPVDEEPWHTRGIRRLLVRKSYVYDKLVKEYINLLSADMLPIKLLRCRGQHSITK